MKGKIVAGVFFIIILIAGASYYHNMKIMGGFENPPENPVQGISVDSEKNTVSRCFNFSVFGEFRYHYLAGKKIIEDAQASQPLFMVNTGGMLAAPDKASMERYLSIIDEVWDRTTPFYHTPGVTELNFGLSGKKPEHFEKIFGLTEYYVDFYNWRFLFMDTSKSRADGGALRWLKNIVKESGDMHLVLFTYCPPEGGSIENGQCTLKDGFADDLADLLEDVDIKAIFTGGGVGVRSYFFKDIPVYVSSLPKDVWLGGVAAEYHNVKLCPDSLEVYKRTIDSEGKAENIKYGN